MHSPIPGPLFPPSNHIDSLTPWLLFPVVVSLHLLRHGTMGLLVAGLLTGHGWVNLPPSSCPRHKAIAIKTWPRVPSLHVDHWRDPSEAVRCERNQAHWKFERTTGETGRNSKSAIRVRDRTGRYPIPDQEVVLCGRVEATHKPAPEIYVLDGLSKSPLNLLYRSKLAIISTLFN
jgi:hypothetical protein